MTKYHRSPVQTAPFFRRTSKMPSARRVKVLSIVFLLSFITFLLWTASVRAKRTPDLRTAGDFYSKTIKGLDKKPQNKADEEVARKMSERLKEAAQVAKDNANAKAPKPDPPSSVVGKGSAAEGAGERGVAGRKKFDQEVVNMKEESPEEAAITTELNAILKKSPMIVFSKSYCPYSKKAKAVLENYAIDPAPYIVELDQHPLGSGLQARLAELTGRRTVPNVLVNAVSIGGGDDVAAMDAKGELADKIKEIGGTKIVTVKLKLQ